MDAGASHLTHGPEPGDARAPGEIGRDPAHGVMHRRRHGDEVTRGIEAVAREHRPDEGEVFSETLHAARVQPRSARAVAGGDGARHDVPRRQLRAGIRLDQEPATVLVHQRRARTPDRLRDEGRGVHARELERGGMELQELDVAQLGAHVVRQRPAIARRHERIGREGVELSHAARRQNDRRSR